MSKQLLFIFAFFWIVAFGFGWLARSALHFYRDVERVEARGPDEGRSMSVREMREAEEEQAAEMGARENEPTRQP